MADIARWNGTSGYPILKLNEAKEVTATSNSAAFKVELTGGDYKTLILINNAGSASANAVFSVGNGRLKPDCSRRRRQDKGYRS